MSTFIAAALYVVFASCLIWAIENYEGYRQGPKWFLTLSFAVAALCGFGMLVLMFMNGVWWHPLALFAVAFVVGSVLGRVPYAAPVAAVLTWLLLLYNLFIYPACITHHLPF